LDQIGEGTLGDVFKVQVNKIYSECMKTQIQVIKKIRLFFELESKLYKVFRKLLDLKKIEDERVIQYFDAWFEILPNPSMSYYRDLYLFVQMELCDGNLRKLIEDMKNDLAKRDKIIFTLNSYSLAYDVLIEILEGVNYLHTRNPELIHGNLKPENILFKIANNSMVIKIGDTGLRSWEQFNNKMLRRKEVVTYKAPEVLKSGKYDKKSDIFSIGVILQELLGIDLNKYFS
jgi:serine/threonine protein kinase